MHPNDWHRQLAAIVLGNSLEAWLYAAAAAALALIVLPRIKSVVLARARKPTPLGERRALFVACISRTHVIFFVAIALFVAIRPLTLGPRTQHIVHIAVLAGMWFQIALWTSAVVVHLIREALVKRGVQHLATAGGFVVISLLAQAVVWVTALALALANAGIDVIALIAGLGVGGAALALALRGFLSNLFANASISLDKLFAVGDQLVTGAFQGKVEHIGNRATQLRSVDGELIVIANADLLKSRLRNFGRIEERREVLALRLPRSTSLTHIREALDIIARVLREQPMARFERCHLASFGADALQLEAVYYVRAGTTTALAEVRDSIDVELNAAFTQRGIDMEYPVQRVHLAFA